MEPAADFPPPIAPSANRLARLLRHEVGDLLQSVYSTVGILLERLPGELALERRLVGDLKSRAELCKVELDAVVELAAPLAGSPARIDLMSTVSATLLQLRRRFPALQINLDANAPAHVHVEPRALASALAMLLQAIAQGAQRQMGVRISHDSHGAELYVQRDGYPATAEQFAWLNEPFASTQHALFGLGLALAQRVVHASGGKVVAANREEGGVAIRITIPLAP